jgi:hypothetical protein
MTQHQTNPEYAAAVERLAAQLVEMPVGSTLTYADLNKAAGKNLDVRNGHRFLLNRARERAEREHGCIFECARTVGIIRLPQERAPDVGRHGLQKITRGARRTEKRLIRLQGNMSEANQRQIIAQIAAFGAIRAVAHPKRVAAVAQNVDIAKPTPGKDALRMFQKKKD